jgi:hypothetical protein
MTCRPARQRTVQGGSTSASRIRTGSTSSFLRSLECWLEAPRRLRQQLELLGAGGIGGQARAAKFDHDAERLRITVEGLITGLR